MLRVISYNLLVGFQDRPERKPRALKWIEVMQPDVLGLQEMNGYTQEQLASEARGWGHAHSLLVKPEGYSPALTARTPIENGARVAEGFLHGMACGTVSGIDVIVVHLNVKAWEPRLRESAVIVERVRASMQARRPVLVMGDFNALSPEDAEYYRKESDVLQYQLRKDVEHKWQNVHDGQIDLAVMQSFQAAGLIDLVARKTRTTRERLSFPTPLVEADANSESYFRRRMRLDYILVSPDLAERCRRAEVIRDSHTDAQSDHYPVVAEFDS